MDRSAGVDVDVEREGEYGECGEEDEGVDEDGLAVGAEAAEVDVAVGARELAQQARGEQHEQHHGHHHGTPVRHRRHQLLPVGDQEIRSQELRSREIAVGSVCGEGMKMSVRGGVCLLYSMMVGCDGRREGTRSSAFVITNAKGYSMMHFVYFWL
jgi:hypothetical protein